MDYFPPLERVAAIAFVYLLCAKALWHASVCVITPHFLRQPHCAGQRMKTIRLTHFWKALRRLGTGCKDLFSHAGGSQG